MPELPEVETTKRGILPYLKGQTIKQIVVRQPKLRWPISEAIFNAHGQEILDVKRRAKYLLLQLPNNWIIIHLGMSGSLRVLLNPQQAAKHDHVDLTLENGVILRYTDPRRFGSWLWAKNLDHVTQLLHLGPEPLSDELTAKYLFSKAQNRHVPIKTFIMDNHIAVGVGNIYASESLFMAKINPNRKVNTLSLFEFEQLVIAIKHVLSKSIEQGGTTLKDFLQSDGKPGYFAQKLQVYGRDGEKCYLCQTEIKSQKIGQRNTFYCEICQK